MAKKGGAGIRLKLVCTNAFLFCLLAAAVASSSEIGRNAHAQTAGSADSSTGVLETNTPAASSEEASSSILESTIARTLFASKNGPVYSGSNRYLAWIDHTTENGNADIFFRRSTDEGASWKPIANLSQNKGNSFNVAMAASGSNVYVVWEQRDLDTVRADIFFRASADNGASWGPKTKLSFTGLNDAVFPQVAASGSSVIVVWSEAGEEIIVKRSPDGGATWDEVNISNSAGHSRYPQTAASGDNFYVIWQDFRNSNYEVIIKRSTDYGETWGSETNLSQSTDHSFLPRIAVKSSNVYAIWTELISGSEDIMFSRSIDKGASWKTGTNLSKNDGRSLNPQISATGSNIYVTWEQDNYKSTTTDIFFRGSLNNGVSWGAKVKLTENGINQEGLPQVAGSGTNVFVVWAESADRILIRRSTDSGTTWEAVRQLSRDDGSSTKVYIATFGTSVSVVWEYTIDTTDIIYRRSIDSGTSWKSSVNISNNSGNSYLTESVPPGHDSI